MGQILMIKNADFSENAVNVESIYDIVKECGNPTLDKVLSLQNWYNTIAITKPTVVYAVEFTLPSDVSSLSKSKSSAIRVGATTGVTGSALLRYVDVDVSDIIAKVVDGDIAGGTTQIVTLPSPVTLNAGEYVVFGNTGASINTANKFVCFDDNPDGETGYMVALNNGATGNFNMAVKFYGLSGD